MGPVLVRALLEAQPGVRIIYKPHPFTGQRDPRAARSHQQIVRLLSEANRETSAPADDPQLSALTTQLGRTDLSVTEHRQLSAAWSSRYWTTVGESRHLVVADQGPTLYDCFDHADLLVADVSSVVSDFLASGKPYVCANPQGLTEAAFRRENPTADAAYLLGPDCGELAEILELVRGSDPWAQGRAAMRDYLLGPVKPPSIARWDAAMRDLMRDTDDDRASRQIGVDESILEADDPQRAASESPTM